MKNPPVKSKSAAVVVVGSLNMDYIARVRALPQPGETVCGTSLERRFGGKGANQAVAAARSGVPATLIGCVGQDADGRAYLEHLAAEGISTQHISKVRGETTGTALIAVESSGENEIVVVSGANGKLNQARVRAARAVIADAGALLLQLETTTSAVLEAMRLANLARVPVIFNPSPLHPEFAWGERDVDTVIVNKVEAEAIFRHNPEKLASNVARWQRALATKRIRRLVVTRGRHPTLGLDEAGFHMVPTVRVKPVDTVGAGDAFAGVYAASVARGREFTAAVAAGNQAGAIATLKHGAQ